MEERNRRRGGEEEGEKYMKLKLTHSCLDIQQ